MDLAAGMFGNHAVHEIQVTRRARGADNVY
jgi:hypothetical protein